MDLLFIRKKGFKKWYKDLDNTYYIMGSDDIDSLGSTYVLNKLFGIETKLFNSFSTLYLREDTELKDLEVSKMVGVDMDLAKNKCFGNHVTYVDNPDCISLNKNIQFGCKEYFDKFAGSTLVTIMSLYDVKLDNFAEEQLEILISIDTAFKQYFFDKFMFKYYYKDILKYPEFVDVVSKHSKNYFYDIIKKYNLHKKIYVDEEGYMETEIKLDKLGEIFGIDLSLPKEKFKKIYYFQDVGMDIHDFVYIAKHRKVFSSAVTSKNFVKASIKYQ